MRISLFANLTTPLLLFVSSLFFVAYGFKNSTLEELKTTNNILSLFRSGPSTSTIKNIGDINGDGIDDLIISYHCNGDQGVHIVFGNKNSVSSIDLDNLLANGQGFNIYNDHYMNDQVFGYGLSPAGDINDDGINDFIVAGYYGAYVFFGRNKGFTNINLSTMTPTQGFRICSSCNYTPAATWITDVASVSNAGDFNHDGIDDIMIGITAVSPLNRSNAGSVYILFGRPGRPGTFSDVNLNEFTSGTQGLKIIGAQSNDTLGSSVSSAGDFNADGIDDVIVALASHYSDPPIYRGCKFYVIYGHEGEFEDLDLATLTKDQGFKISADNNDQQLAYRRPWMTANAGDFNGDGISDIALAIERYSNILSVVFGVSGGLTDFTLDNFPHNQGFQVNSSSGHPTHFIASPADINGDGMSDLIFGLDTYWQIIYGRKDGVSLINLENLTSADGFRINITSNPDLIIPDSDWPGESIDFNNDGAVDLVMRTNITYFSVILNRHEYKTNVTAIIAETVGPCVLVLVSILIYVYRRKALQRAEAEKNKMGYIPPPEQDSTTAASGSGLTSPTADSQENVPTNPPEISVSYETDSPQNKEEEQQ